MLAAGHDACKCPWRRLLDGRYPTSPTDPKPFKCSARPVNRSGRRPLAKVVRARLGQIFAYDNPYPNV